MGGGNGQKSAAARAKNQAKAKKGAKGSELSSNAAALTLVCKICRASFMSTSNDNVLKQHHEGKHSKMTIGQCFDKFAA